MGYPHRAIPFGWNAAPGSFLAKPFGQSCFGSWPALGTRTKAFGPGRLAPALPNNPNQSLRHVSARFSTFQTASKSTLKHSGHADGCGNDLIEPDDNPGGARSLSAIQERPLLTVTVSSGMTVNWFPGVKPLPMY